MTYKTVSGSFPGCWTPSKLFLFTVSCKPNFLLEEEKLDVCHFRPPILLVSPSHRVIFQSSCFQSPSSLDYSLQFPLPVSSFIVQTILEFVKNQYKSYLIFTSMAFFIKPSPRFSFFPNVVIIQAQFSMLHSHLSKYVLEITSSVIQRIQKLKFPKPML